MTEREGRVRMSEVSPALAEYVEKILAEAPPLSDEQRVGLCELLRPVRRPSGNSEVSAE
jgi:hypothetical protein